MVTCVTAAALAATGCTTFDDLVADPQLGAGGPDGGSNCTDVNTCPPRYQPVGSQCKIPQDCDSFVCVDGLCAGATSTDGVKNGTETDVDCGGTSPTRCVEGKKCNEAADCVWKVCTANVCEGHKPGRQDGDQTDIDCGGTMSPACDWDKKCLLDSDCTSKACSTDKKVCLVGPSCLTVHGGSTCGTGEFGDGQKAHESCCKSLPVAGFTDATHPGKTVFLDKYEITAGRMRAFIEALKKADAAGIPNVQAYAAAHRPTRWNPGWENLLPQGFENGSAAYTVTNPTVDLLYPGQDRYVANNPSIQSPSWTVTSGAYNVDTGIFFQLGSAHYFPEYAAQVPPWPSADYGATHNLNCYNDTGAYGYSTYWFDNTTVNMYSGGIGKAFTKEEMDEKALNCAPFALYAALCLWDGGELMTTDVFDFVAGGPWPPNAGGIPAPLPPAPPRLTGGNTTCNNDTLNTAADGTGSCPNVYYFPPDKGQSFDGSSRIAPPGRVPADAVAINAGDEPWMDLKGNLQEAAIKPDGLFDYRGYGIGWSSLQAHRNQITTPRMKGGSFGARCMRFK